MKILGFQADTKTVVIIVAVVIMLAAIYFWGWQAGRGKFKNIGGFFPEGEEPSPEEQQELQALAQQFREVYTSTATPGNGIWQTRCELCQSLAEMDYNTFVAMYNYYKAQYSRSMKEELGNVSIRACSYFSTNWEDELLQKIEALGLV